MSLICPTMPEKSGVSKLKWTAGHPVCTPTVSLTTVGGCKDIRIGYFMSNIKNYMSFACVAILYLYGELMSISLSGFSYSLERK